MCVCVSSKRKISCWNCGKSRDHSTHDCAGVKYGAVAKVLPFSLKKQIHCYVCGKNGHFNCAKGAITPLKSRYCSNCGKKGHVNDVMT